MQYVNLFFNWWKKLPSSVQSVIENYIITFVIKLISFFKRSKKTMAKIELVVKNSSGTALSGVAIAYNYNSQALSGTTNANGILDISDLAAGTYAFTATLSGYTTKSVNVTFDGATDVTESIVMETGSSSTANNIISAAESAGAAILSSTGLAEIETLLEKAESKITELKTESSTTKSTWVKARNYGEVVLLYSIIGAAAAGATWAITALKNRFL